MRIGIVVIDPELIDNGTIGVEDTTIFGAEIGCEEATFTVIQEDGTETDCKAVIVPEDMTFQDFMDIFLTADEITDTMLEECVVVGPTGGDDEDDDDCDNCEGDCAGDQDPNEALDWTAGVQ